MTPDSQKGEIEVRQLHQLEDFATSLRPIGSARLGWAGIGLVSDRGIKA